MKNKIKDIIEASILAKKCLMDSEGANIEKAAKSIIASLQAGGKVMIFGNGGSAADSQHMAAELVGRFKKDRRALPAIALTTNTSTLTAIANDYGYHVVFSRQIEALGKSGDVAIGISTSGNSKNILQALKKAGEMGIGTIGLTGSKGGSLAKACDIAIVVPSDDTPRIQEAHLLICHVLCELVEKEMFK